MKHPAQARSALARAAALAGVALIGALLFVTLVQPRIAEWGSTARERQTVWPGDAFTPSPGFVWTNAITIERPARSIWPWLAQWGQGRAGLYSYDWLENAVGCGVDSTTEVLPQYQRRLGVGSKEIRMCRYAPANPIAVFAPGRALVMGTPGDDPTMLAAGRASSTWAFILDPVDADTTRLIVRSRADSLMTRLQGPLQFVMQRQTMRGIEQRAEGTKTPLVEVLAPVLWLLAAAIFALAAVRVLVQGQRWWQPLAISFFALMSLGWLMFWQPSPIVGVVLVASLTQVLVRTIRSTRGTHASTRGRSASGIDRRTRRRTADGRGG